MPDQSLIAGIFNTNILCLLYQQPIFLIPVSDISNTCLWVLNLMDFQKIKHRISLNWWL